ncbi:MAG: hypothetical protein KatS3mg096_369 [Candidatus Parcubacteria bacterium]|nr:MAG: hypothetical protein KatS3mg096_369 [Candidatus Parcubacteria bacterium]
MDDYVNAWTGPGSQITDRVTVSAWARNVGAPSAFNTIIANYASNAGWAIRTAESGISYLHFLGRSGAGEVRVIIASEAETFNGAWHHVAFTVSGGVARTYLDGGFVASASGVVNLQPATTTLIGKGHIGGLGFWNGLIDEVRIYNRALSDQEIKVLYEATK